MTNAIHRASNLEYFTVFVIGHLPFCIVFVYCSKFFATVEARWGDIFLYFIVICRNSTKKRTQFIQKTKGVALLMQHTLVVKFLVFSFCCQLRLRKIKLRNSRRLIATPNTATMPSVKYGCVGAIVARRRMGKPKTIAGNC